jgi:hypothetical protein
MEIKIVSQEMASKEIKESLEQIPNWMNTQINLELRPTKLRLRNTDPTVLVAIASAASTTLGYLITGILNIVKERQLAKVTIETKDGTKIEIPANYPIKNVDDIIAKLKSLEVVRVELIK